MNAIKGTIQKLVDTHGENIILSKKHLKMHIKKEKEALKSEMSSQIEEKIIHTQEQKEIDMSIPKQVII